MSGKFLLDTNIVIAVFAADPAVLSHLAQVAEVYVSSIVLGELYFGAQHSGRMQQNLARIDAYGAGNVVLDCDTDTARQYGLIKKQLRAKGRPIPENDIWIAAIARQWSLTLATRDAHFGEVEKLQIELW
jgi:tRNA(fMet)-specific endonuclease VapC